MGRRRWVAALVGVALAVVACTPDGEDAVPSPAPADPPEVASPTAGVRVGFVLPTAASEDDEQRMRIAEDLRLVGALRDEGISELRTLEPSGPEFVADLAALLADRRTDLICVLGPEGQRVAAPLALRHPQLTFCAVPSGASDPPDNLVAIEIRFEELGHVVGIAAASVAHGGPVASIIGSDRAGVTRFREGIRVGVEGRQLLETAPSDEEGVLEAVDAAVEAGAGVVVLDVGVGAVAGAARAVDAGLRVIAPKTVLEQLELDEAGPEQQAIDAATVLTWRLRWDVPIRPVVASMLDPDVEIPLSVGLAENAFVVTLGGALGGANLTRVEDAVLDLRRGLREPLDPPPNGASTPAPDDGAADDEAGDAAGAGGAGGADEDAGEETEAEQDAG